MPEDGQNDVDLEPRDSPEEGSGDLGRRTGEEQAAVNREDDPPA